MSLNSECCLWYDGRRGRCGDSKFSNRPVTFESNRDVRFEFESSQVPTIALSFTACELFDVEYHRDLEMWVRGHSKSLKVMPFESLGAVSYSSSIVTLAVSVAICEIFSVKEWCDLENRVRVPSKSLEMAPFDRVPIHLP